MKNKKQSAKSQSAQASRDAKMMADSEKVIEAKNPGSIKRIKKLPVHQIEALQRDAQNLSCYCYFLAQKKKEKAPAPKKKIPVAWKMPKHVNRWN